MTIRERIWFIRRLEKQLKDEHEAQKDAMREARSKGSAGRFRR